MLIGKLLAKFSYRSLRSQNKYPMLIAKKKKKLPVKIKDRFQKSETDYKISCKNQLKKISAKI